LEVNEFFYVFVERTTRHEKILETTSQQSQVNNKAKQSCWVIYH